MSKTGWTPLISILDAWRAEGSVAQFWLRDDDAVEPTPALLRLTELCARHKVPVTLAVIPAHAGTRLADLLRGQAGVDVALHGWSHENHAPPDEKKQELGPHRAADAVLRGLADGCARLSSLFREQFVPVLVPPWNRIDEALLPRLREIGVGGLPVFGPEKNTGLPTVNTHADIMDWHDTRGCRPASDIIADIVKRLEQMRAGGGAMGLLTHHLVHDEPAWQFLDGLLAATADHPGCRWRGISELLPLR